MIMTRTSAFFRPWLIAGFVLMALKLAFTALFVAEHHHVTLLPHAINQPLWWFTKIAPPFFVLAFVLDAKQVGNARFARFLTWLLILTLIYYTIGVYALLHGWRGTPI